MSRIEMVISDFGGVLTTPLDLAFATLNEDVGIEREYFVSAMKAIFEDTGIHPLFELECGRITQKAFEDQLADEVARQTGTRPDVRDFGLGFFNALDPNPGMLDLIREVRRDGYRTALLTNNVKEWEPLWRVHAVHHAPQRLYTLNVGRFHPIDKGLQFVFDALPFLALGVQEDVLSLYFVWYAVNGFFQHSNADVRLGWLNYVVSGPELHRWHHSMQKEESNHNYGNHLIVWDVVFGSRYLPADGSVGALGLVNRQYPRGFLDQMAAPFTPGLDKQTV